MATGAAGERAGEPGPRPPGGGRAWPRRPGRLGHAVLASLVDQIVSGELAPGAQLLPEPALCEAFAVSRPVVRESIKLLEEKGLVRVKQGHGTTVQPAEQWNLLDPLVLDSALRNGETFALIDDLVEVRGALESRMARRAAALVDDDQLAQLQGQLHLLESLMARPVEYSVADLEFHDLIARFSRNQVARSVIRSVEPYWHRNEIYNDPHRLTEDDVFAHEGHIAIFEQLARRDGEGAARAAEEHVTRSWSRLKAKYSVRSGQLH